MASDSSSPPSDSPPSPATPPPSSPPPSPSPPPPKTSPPPSSQPPPASPPPPASSPPPKHSPSPPPPPPPPKDSPSAPTPKHSPPPPPPPKDSPSAPTPKHSPPSPPATSPPPKASPSPPPPQNSNPSPPPSSSKTPSPPPPPSDGNDTQPTSPPLPSPPAPSPQSSGNDPQSPPPSQQLAPSSPLSPRSSPPSDTPAPNGGSTSGTTVPLIIGVSVAAGLLLFITLLVYSSCTREKKKRGLRWNSMHPPLPPLASPLAVNGGGYMSSNFSGSQGPSSPQPHTSLAVGFSKSTFTYDELAAATEGFSKANLLGEGGFGHVHKGVLPNGKEVAVKSLKAGSGQGQREFRAEVEIISRVHHRHLVSLVGYCIAGARRLLVYEFLPNKTLEYHLHGKGRPTLEWSTRLKIALGSAKGLAYLHEDCHPRIIHRDIKCSNILLDYSFEAKVADFGLAKLNQDNFSHVSTRVMGTFGYLAPEYASSGKLTDKSDVFSYGVMLLELITGRRPVDSGGHLDESLVDWARPLCARALEEGNFDQLADPRLENNYVAHEMTRMVACAAGSIMHSAIRRPKMSQIVRALEGDVSLEDLKLGIKPSQSSELGPSSEYDAGSYGANMTKFNKMVFESNEYASSECEATSEYGLNPSSTSSSGSHEMCRKTSIKQHRLASS